jgi:oxygen-dependent protoporphyrinogen oxidase
VVEGRSEEALIRTARRDFDELLGTRGAPLFSRVVRYPHAMPRYGVGHVERARAIADAVAAVPGLALAGNALFGVGIPDTIASGERAAARILAG